MKTITKRIFAITGALALGLTAVHAQSDGALLDALVQKGVLSDQEAEDVRASEAKDYATTPAGKLSLSDHITNLKLYGDARMRFEYLDERLQSIPGAAANPHATTTDRNRYRIRVGADYTFTDNFKAGFELESATAGDSANQTMGNEFGKFPINVGLLYLQWKPVDWLTLTGGKQKNPIYTTDLVWDADINPEGGSEVATWTFPVDFSDPAPISNDPKAIAPPAPEPSTMSFTLGFIGGQFCYSDAAEATVPGASNTPKTDIWMFVEQLPVQFNFNKDTFIKVVPGFTSYMGGGNLAAPAPGLLPGLAASVGNGSSVTFAANNGTDNLQIFTAPGEVDWKLWEQPFKAYWDFALNTEGKQRIQGVYLANNGNGTNATQAQNRSLGDNIAWLAGLQVGKNKKKGDWSFKGDFRQVGLGAVDPNINDSDFGDSYLNQQGIKLQSVYSFTDFLTGSLTFFDTWALKNELMNGNAGEVATTVPLGSGLGGTATGTSLVNIHSSQRVQVDLIWKF